MSDQPSENTEINCDPELLPFLQRLQADPNDYLANKVMARSLSQTPDMMPLSEGFLARALAHNKTDDPEYEEMLALMAWVLGLKGDVQGEINAYNSLSRFNPDNLTYIISMANAYFQNGDVDTASGLYKKTISLLLEYAAQNCKSIGEPLTQVIEPEKPMRTRFGELAEKLSLYAKARILGLTPDIRALFLVLEEEVVNGCLFECLRHSLSDYVTFVSSREERDRLKVRYKGKIHLDHYIADDGRGLPREPLHTLVQRQWEESGRGPLVHMPDKYDDMGRDMLRRKGMPEDAWFVCFHARNMGFHDETALSNHNIYRNAHIRDYLAAMDAVRERGGWVVRIGDETMPPLDKMENVIDYSACDWREDWIDIFLLARQRFLVATASGPPAVALAFGVPVVATNWFPAGLWLPSTRDIVIHKLYRRRADGGYLGVDEMVRPPMGGMQAKKFFDTHGIDVEDNSPEDIRDAVTEMIDICEGTVKYTPDDERMQRRFRILADGMDVGVNPRAGRDFLRRHRFLIGEDDG